MFVALSFTLRKNVTFMTKSRPNLSLGNRFIIHMKEVGLLLQTDLH